MAVLPTPGLAHQQRIVLAAAAQHLDHALELVLAPDQGIDLAGLGHRIEVLGVGVERALRLVAALLLGLGLLLFLLLLRRLGDAVRDVVDHVEPGDPALVEEIHRVRFLLAEDRHEHVGARDLLLAGGLHVQDRALDHALEALRGLRVGVGVGSETGRVLLDEVAENATQLVEIDPAGLEDFRRRGVVEHREQKVLDRDEFVLLLPGLDKGHMEGDFEFLRDHRPTFFLSASAEGFRTVTITPTSPPSCTAKDAGACVRC